MFIPLAKPRRWGGEAAGVVITATLPLIPMPQPVLSSGAGFYWPGPGAGKNP